MRRAHWVWFLGLISLGGCAVTPPAGTPVDWNTIKVQRQSLERWGLSGRAAVNAANEGWSASMEWQQDRERSRLRLHGPFGMGALVVSTDGESLQIETGGEAYTGSQAREILEQTLGVPLPLKSMRYWLLGVPEPEGPALAQLNEQGNLASLDQDGWRIVYDQYAWHQGQWLPSRLSAERGDVRLKVIVNRWRLGS